jgi:hypothetical protein
MTRRVTPVLFAAILASTFTLASAQAIRSGNFVSCTNSKSCSQETINGQRFYVIETPQLVVKVALNPDSKYNHFAIALENRSSYGIRVSPSDFRIEVTEPKFKRLSYIEPEKLRLPKVKIKNQPLPPPTLGNSFVAASDPAPHQAGGPLFLTESTLAPAATASGEVFFERDGKPGSMSLLMPIAGMIYEFQLSPAK